MIAACPKCNARYRVDVERLAPGGSRLRCTRCRAVFRVSPPAVPEEREPVRTSEPQRPADESKIEAPRSQPVAIERPRRPDHAILLAEADVESGKRMAEMARSWGLDPILVHDGVEAILNVQRLLPRAVILDAALPRMFGFQVCELMKRNASLQTIPVVLIGAIHHRDRYRRPATEYYGADGYVERPQLPGALRSLLVRFGLPVTGAEPAAALEVVPSPAPAISSPPPAVEPVPATVDAVAPLSKSAPAPVASPVVSPATPEPEIGSEGAARAERLARIVVSDIILYNPERFEAGVRDGDVVAALASELAEGRQLFVERIDASVRRDRDFLTEELLRVARQRGMA